MSLFISSATASSALTDSPISEAITRLAATVAIEKQRGTMPEGPSLDVTFMLPGQLDKPDFSGMRMGGYTDESHTLFFERAVPEHIVHSDQASHYVAVVMQDVINHASEFFREKDITFEAGQWHHIMERLAAADVRLS